MKISYNEKKFQFVLLETYYKKYVFSLLKKFVVHKFTNLIGKIFHCKKLTKKKLLENLIVNKIMQSFIVKNVIL